MLRFTIPTRCPLYLFFAKKDAATIGAMLRFRLSFQRFLKPHKISLKKTKMLQNKKLKI